VYQRIILLAVSLGVQFPVYQRIILLAVSLGVQFSVYQRIILLAVSLGVQIPGTKGLNCLLCHWVYSSQVPKDHTACCVT